MKYEFLIMAYLWLCGDWQRWGKNLEKNSPELAWKCQEIQMAECICSLFHLIEVPKPDKLLDSEQGLNGNLNHPAWQIHCWMVCSLYVLASTKSYICPMSFDIDAVKLDHDQKHKGVWGCLRIHKFKWMCRRAPNIWDIRNEVCVWSFPSCNDDKSSGQTIRKTSSDLYEEKASRMRRQKTETTNTTTVDYRLCWKADTLRASRGRAASWGYPERNFEKRSVPPNSLDRRHQPIVGYGFIS